MKKAFLYLVTYSFDQRINIAQHRPSVHAWDGVYCFIFSYHFWSLILSRQCAVTLFLRPSYPYYSMLHLLNLDFRNPNLQLQRILIQISKYVGSLERDTRNICAEQLLKKSCVLSSCSFWLHFWGNDEGDHDQYVKYTLFTGNVLQLEHSIYICFQKHFHRFEDEQSKSRVVLLVSLVLDLY